MSLEGVLNGHENRDHRYTLRHLKAFNRFCGNIITCTVTLNLCPLALDDN